jgi:hypothetical protein
MMIAFIMGVVAGFGFGFVFFRNDRAYHQGWENGRAYERSERLKTDRPLLSAKTGEWSEPNENNCREHQQDR